MIFTRRAWVRLCLALTLALGLGLALPAPEAAAQGFSIEIGPGGVQIGANCPRTYDPVCAGPRSNPRTYRNACLAQREGARIRYEGECERGDDDDFVDRGPVCPRNYAPVCGEVRGRQQTFNNSCLAEVARANILYRGECRRGGGGFIEEPPRPPVGRACPRIFAPVCAGPRGRERTYPNSCQAEQAGARIRYPGECR